MKILEVNIPQKKYFIYIQKGILDLVGEDIKKIYKHKKIAVITDSNVNELYGKRLKDNLENAGYETYQIVITPGEESKSFTVLEKIYDKLSDIGITRSDLIITFGGGVAGDIGGFAAATFLRGVSFIQIPTSLLAQVDSSIGGKVAVDTKKGKNLVGNFYQPKAVYIDPELLGTLSDKYFQDGMGEVIKYGAIKDFDLFKRLSNFSKEELQENIEDVIYDCCDIKRKVVENDEKEKGERMLLNFGHTIGHSIENYFEYKGYSHGEAVGIGMYNITLKSEKMGLTKAGTGKLLKNILKKYNLPYELPKMDKDKVIQTIKRDKKSSGNDINLILLKNIGEAYIHKINMEEIHEFI